MIEAPSGISGSSFCTVKKVPLPSSNGVRRPRSKGSREAPTSRSATLYRHFPRRIDLLVAVYGRTLREFLDGIEATVESADPWDGFRATNGRHLPEPPLDDELLYRAMARPNG
jgi:hypothetical protein